MAEMMFSIAAQVVLEVCADADLGSQCVLTCKTPDNTQFISFAKTSDLSNTLGFCLVNGGGCSVTDPNKYYMNQTGGVTKFIILSHNKSDTGTWRCDYSGTFNDRTLKWAQLPTAILTSTGISANTVVNQTSSIPVTVGVGCLYSENAPVVEVQYLPETYLYVMTCAKSATLCGDSDLSAYDCNKTITSVDATCGDTLYTMQLKVSVSNTRNTYQQQLFSPFKIKFECLPIVSMTSTTLNSTTTKPHPSPGYNMKDPVIGTVAGVSIGIVVTVILVLIIKYCRRQHDTKENINMTETV